MKTRKKQRGLGKPKTLSSEQMAAIAFCKSINTDSKSTHKNANDRIYSLFHEKQGTATVTPSQMSSVSRFWRNVKAGEKLRPYEVAIAVYLYDFEMKSVNDLDAKYNV